MEKILRKLLHSDEKLGKKKNMRMVDFKFDTRKNGQLRYMDRYHLDENNLKGVVARKSYF